MGLRAARVVPACCGSVALVRNTRGLGSAAFPSD